MLRPHVPDRADRLHRHRRPGQFRPGAQRIRAGFDRARLRQSAAARPDQLHRRGDQHDLAGQRRLGAGETPARHPMAQRTLDARGPGSGGGSGAGAAGAHGQRDAGIAAATARAGHPGRRRTADAAPASAHRAIRETQHIVLRHRRRRTRRAVQHRRATGGVPFLPAAVDPVGNPLDTAHGLRAEHTGAHQLAERARRTALADDRDGAVLHAAGIAGRAVGRAYRAADLAVAHAPAGLRAIGADRHRPVAAGDPAPRIG